MTGVHPNLLPLSLLLLFAAGSFWMLKSTEQEFATPRRQAHEPDYFLNALRTTEMDATGAPLRRLEAAEMKHYPDDDSTEIDQPVLTLFQGREPPWRIRSEDAWLSGDGELLLLQGRVQIDREASENQRPITIITRNLRVQAEANYAETDHELQIRSLGSWVESTGMRAWFGKPMRLKLLSNVRGRYEIN